MDRSATTAVAARQGDGDGTRWKAPAQASSALRNVTLTERRRRVTELAAADLDDALKQEALEALREKARDLQKDMWMYEDINF